MHTLPDWFHFGADRSRGSADPSEFYCRVLTACQWLRDISSPFFLFLFPSLSAIFLLVSLSFLFFFISQKAFREYLDEVDTQPVQACEGKRTGNES